LALAVACITTSIPSKFVFNHLGLLKLEPEVVNMYGDVSQLEVSLYGAKDETSENVEIMCENVNPKLAK
jgi:hypothetical protein